MFKKYKKYIYVGGAILITLSVFLLKDKIVYLQNLGYIGIFLLSLLGNATVILPLPAILTAFVGGAFLNPFLVGIVSSLGATFGELTGYMAGLGGEEFVKNDPKFQKVNHWMDKYGLWAIFVLAAIPNPLFDLAGIVAGASKIPVYKYLVVVWLGKFIKFVTIAYLGYAIF